MATLAALVDEKACGSCGEVLPASMFHRSKRTTTGLKSWCKDCRRQREGEANRQRAARHYARDPEAWNARNAASYRRHRAKRQAKNREWKETNAERYQAIRRQHRIANAEKVQAAIRQWQREHPDRVRLYQTTRQRRIHSGAVTPDQLAARIAYWGYRCWVCGDAWDSIDHVKPLAAGGLHLASNLRPICRPCNSRKGAKWEGVTWQRSLAS